MDSIAPYEPLSWVANYSDPSYAITYPDLHFIILLPVYAVTLLIHLLIGNWHHVESVFPFGFDDPFIGMGSLIFVTRLVSLLMGVTALLLLFRFHHPRIPKAAPSVAAIILAFSGVYSYYSANANLDIPYLFWFILASLFVWRYLFEDEKNRRLLLPAAVFSAFSVATKDPAAGYVCGLGALILFVGPQGKWSFKQNVKDALRFTLIALGVYVVVAILPQPFRWVVHVQDITSGEVRDLYKEVAPTFTGHLDLLFKTFRMLANNLSWPGVMLAYAGLVWLAIKREWRLFAFFTVPGIAYYVLIITNVLSIYERFVLVDSYLLSLLIGTIIVRIYQQIRQTRPKWTSAYVALLLILLFAHGIYGYYSTAYIRLFNRRDVLTTTLPEYVPPGSAIRWQASPGYFRLPGPEVFTDYRLIRPPGLSVDIDKVKHVYSPYDPTYRYVLSEHALDESTFGGLRLLRAYKPPAWMKRRWEHMTCFNEYHLYERISDQPMRLDDEPYSEDTWYTPTQADIQATLRMDGVVEMEQPPAINAGTE